MESDNKKKYREFCESDETIPIFSRDWWLDAVVGPEGWDVALVERDGKIVASMPYCQSSKWWFKMLRMPPLTQTLGPWIRYQSTKSTKRLAREKDLFQELIDHLPHHHVFSQNFHHTYTNWLPFYWKGFKQTTRYTYRLDNLVDEEALWKDLQSNIRREIRKAKNRFHLEVRDDLMVEDFIQLNSMVFGRQGMRQPYSAKLIERLDKACLQNDARKILIAVDPDGKMHAGVYIVWDQESAYYLMGGGDPALRNSGATSLCMWEAIRFSATKTASFDFEGSMIETVERFFRAFGARQTPYFTVSKTPSRLFRTLQMVRSIIR